MSEPENFGTLINVRPAAILRSLAVLTEALDEVEKLKYISPSRCMPSMVAGLTAVAAADAPTVTTLCTSHLLKAPSSLRLYIIVTF